jgi:hypothetical protein
VKEIEKGVGIGLIRSPHAAFLLLLPPIPPPLPRNRIPNPESTVQPSIREEILFNRAVIKPYGVGRLLPLESQLQSELSHGRIGVWIGENSDGHLCLGWSWIPPAAASVDVVIIAIGVDLGAGG